MTELRKVLRWLTRAAMLQSTVIFVLFVLLTGRLSTVHSRVTDALYANHAATQQIDTVNQFFFSLSSLMVWLFITGLALTGVGYGLLRRIITETWPISEESNSASN